MQDRMVGLERALAVALVVTEDVAVAVAVDTGGELAVGSGASMTLFLYTPYSQGDWAIYLQGLRVQHRRTPRILATVLAKRAGQR